MTLFVSKHCMNVFWHKQPISMSSNALFEGYWKPHKQWHKLLKIFNSICWLIPILSHSKSLALALASSSFTALVFSIHIPILWFSKTEKSQVKSNWNSSIGENHCDAAFLQPNVRSFARYLLRSNRSELYAIVILLKLCRCVYVCVCVLICLHIIPTECLVLVALLCCDSSRALILIYFSFSFDYVGLFQNNSRNTFQKHPVFALDVWCRYVFVPKTQNVYKKLLLPLVWTLLWW